MRGLLRSIALIGACLSCACLSPAIGADGMMDPELQSLFDGANINPFDAASTNNLALKLIRQGRYERALKLLDRAVRLAPERLHIQRNRDQLELLMSQMKSLDLDTANDFDRSFADTEIPFVPEPWGQKTPSVRSLASSSEGAISEPAATANPFDAESLVVIADIKSERGDYRGALLDLRRAQALSPWLSGLAYRIEQLEARVSNLGEIEPDSAKDSLEPPRLPGRQSPSGDDAEPPAPWQATESVS